VDYTIRTATPEEIPAMQEVMGVGFGFDTNPEANAHLARTVELDRTRCAFDGSSMVGTSGAFSLDFTVPGGALPTGGTTLVSVRSTHRRRGLLRAMMRAHIEDVREREEPLAALWAAESGIYGRFGYGPATILCRLEVERAHSAFSRPVSETGQFRLITPEDAEKLFPRVYDQVFRLRPGHFARSAVWWERRTSDPEWEREGATKFRYALYEEAGQPRGYLQYRIRNAWHDSGVPNSTLLIAELQGIDRTARAALWRYALDVDLVSTIQAWNQPVDEILPWLLEDPRRLRQSQRDALWLRVVDVPRALEGRAYAGEPSLRFDSRPRISVPSTWGATASRHSATPAGSKAAPMRCAAPTRSSPGIHPRGARRSSRTSAPATIAQASGVRTPGEPPIFARVASPATRARDPFHGRLGIPRGMSAGSAPSYVRDRTSDRNRRSMRSWRPSPVHRRARSASVTTPLAFVNRMRRWVSIR
jgi:predicted acetyltransferase